MSKNELTMTVEKISEYKKQHLEIYNKDNIMYLTKQEISDLYIELGIDILCNSDDIKNYMMVKYKLSEKENIIGMLNDLVLIQDEEKGTVRQILMMDEDELLTKKQIITLIKQEKENENE